MIIHSKSKLKQIIDNAKKSKKTVLIKKGVFDIIHPGHIFLLKKLKQYADIVIILAQSDEFTHRKKDGCRPINNQKKRMEVLDGLRHVDYVFQDKSRSREEYVNLLNFLKPNVVAVITGDSNKTKDYTSRHWKLKELPDKIKHGFSTTGVINKILENCNDI